MADENTDDLGRDDDRGGETPPKKGTPPPRESDDLPDDPEELKARLKRQQEALKKANQEAASRRKRLEELEDAEQRRKDGELSEVDKLRKERDDLVKKERVAAERAAAAEHENREQRINTAVERYAQTVDVQYPDIVPSLINRKLVTIDEDSGDIQGVKDAVDKLIRFRPGLVQAKGGGGTPPRDGGAGRRRERETAPPGREEPNPYQDMREEGGYDF